MNRLSALLRLGIIVTVLILISIAFRATVLRAQPVAPQKTAEQAFKNIQTLKGIPADQLIPTMQFVSAALGVECEFCHAEGAFDKDDKKPKQTARKMMEMVFAVNKSSFDGHRAVTCYSCHRGNSHPIAIPIVPTAPEVAENRETNKDIHPEDPTANSAAIVDPILEKYVSSLGGATALQKITSRVENGTVDLGGKQFPIDIYTQAPDKRVSVMHLPNGDSVTAYNGAIGWQSVPGRPTQWMSSAEVDSTRLDADLYLPIRMRQTFSEFRILPKESIDGREVVVLQGVRNGKPPANFYFDQQSGLLLRMVRYTDTALGLNPTQIDFANYRDSGGVKIPFQRTIARPRGRFTVQVEHVQQNVPIDEQKFAPPPPQASERKP